MVFLEFNWDFDLGVIIGLLGIAVSIIAITKTRKIEKQQFLLNKFALENEEKKREEEKHANIIITPIDGTKSNNYMTVKFANTGKCKADNIHVQILNDTYHVLRFSPNPPSSLNPGEIVEVGFECYDNPFYIKYKIQWEDKSGIGFFEVNNFTHYWR